ncbi:SPOR domain-containing protein [bacterium]|nr:SPOR domain-containing protein [bacterium]
MIKNISVYVSVLIFVLFSGCASSKLGWQGQSDSDKDDSPRYVEDFDPKMLAGDEVTVTPVLDKNPVANAEPVSGIQAGNINSETAAQVMGYRIQIMIGKNKAAIDEEHQKAMFKFDAPVYVEFLSPNYKIRVGDCLTRHEADKLRRIAANRHHYTGAWVVRCMVNRKITNNAP